MFLNITAAQYKSWKFTPFLKIAKEGWPILHHWAIHMQMMPIMLLQPKLQDQLPLLLKLW